MIIELLEENKKREELLLAVREEFKDDSSVQVQNFVTKLEKSISDKSVQKFENFSSSDYLAALKMLYREKEAAEFLKLFSLKDFVLLERQQKNEKISEITALKKGLKHKKLTEKVNELLEEIKF